MLVFETSATPQFTNSGVNREQSAGGFAEAAFGPPVYRQAKSFLETDFWTVAK
jgi:hypothetical protein